MTNEITFEVMEHIGTIATRNNWSKECNIVAWNGGQPKLDIREWDEKHERMTRGITLFEEQAEKLAQALTEYKAKADRVNPDTFEPTITSEKEVTFEIVEHIGTLDTTPNGWAKEVNLVSWNGAMPKIDIRDWDEHHERMSRGITLTTEEGDKAADILANRYGIGKK